MRNPTPNPILAERGNLVTTRSAPKSSAVFRGWGPKLVGFALAAAALSGVHAGAAASEAGVQPASCMAEARFPAPDEMPPPDYPAIARADHVTGSVLIRFDVAPGSNVLGTTIVQSSGSLVLDEAALLAAREVRLKPAAPDCQTPAQSFAYSYEFGD
jgi:TonB family protein